MLKNNLIIFKIHQKFFLSYNCGLNLLDFYFFNLKENVVFCSAFLFSFATIGRINIEVRHRPLIFVGLWLDNVKPNSEIFISKCVEAILKAKNEPSLKKLGEFQRCLKKRICND